MKYFLMLSLSFLLQDSYAALINIYQYKGVTEKNILYTKGTLVLQQGQSKGNKRPEEAFLVYYNLKNIDEFFFKELQRNSWDGKGARIEATFNAGGLIPIYGLNQNASWLGTDISSYDPRAIGGRFIFGKGKKNELDGFEVALDVVAHEFTHAVIDSTSKLEYEGQSGALNEHLADVFGVIINQYVNPKFKNPYQLGSTLKNNFVLRDMEKPENGNPAQPAHMNDLTNNDKFREYAPGCVASSSNDYCGVHYLSGIPNKMAAYVLKNLDRRIATQIFYNVMTTHLKANSDFNHYAASLLTECKKYENTCPVFEEGLKMVGMIPDKK